MDYKKRLWYGSDFHLEQRRRVGIEVDLPDRGDIDGVLLAGDMGNSRALSEQLEVFTKLSDFVVFTPGNHEYWDGRTYKRGLLTMDEQNDLMRIQCSEMGIHFLNNSSVDVPNTQYTIWGSPWFTDYMRLPSLANIGDKVGGIGDYLTTFKTVNSLLTPYDHIQLCMEAQDSLVMFLRYCEEAGRKPIIMTHFPPSIRSDNPQYAFSEYTTYFATNWLDKNHELFPKGTVWIHGHTHWNVDYQLGNVRVTSNQAGYPGEIDCSLGYVHNKCIEVPSSELEILENQEAR